MRISGYIQCLYEKFHTASIFLNGKYHLPSWELEKSLYLSNFSKEVCHLTDWQTYKKFRIISKWCNNIPGMCPKMFRKISHSGPEIWLYLSNFSKEVSQLTDWQTCKQFGSPRILINVSKNVQKDISSRIRDIPILA